VQQEHYPSWRFNCLSATIKLPSIELPYPHCFCFFETQFLTLCPVLRDGGSADVAQLRGSPSPFPPDLEADGGPSASTGRGTRHNRLVTLLKFGSQPLPNHSQSQGTQDLRTVPSEACFKTPSPTGFLGHLFFPKWKVLHSRDCPVSQSRFWIRFVVIYLICLTVDAEDRYLASEGYRRTHRLGLHCHEHG
jgi:hypothetical protein